jgi:hypothetical protein
VLSETAEGATGAARAAGATGAAKAAGATGVARAAGVVEVKFRSPVATLPMKKRKQVAMRELHRFFIS